MNAAAVSTSNGARPHVDLNEILGPRVGIRDVTLGDRVYQFRPLNLVVAQLLEQEKIIEAFRALIVGDDAADQFLNEMPAAQLYKVITAIYGEATLGEASPPSPGSAKKKPASKPSKRTSTRRASR